MNTFIRCTHCIMDNRADPTIQFNLEGRCNYCTTAHAQIGSIYFPGIDGTKKLNALLDEIKLYGKGKKYDCVMGLSGGLDSSYLAYLGHKWGLRVLAIHIDDGFDTEISKRNLTKLVMATGFDYEVVQPDAVQFNGLTKAFLLAGVPNLAIPQDNVLFAFLYQKMKSYKIKYFLTGGNFALECILQRGNTYSAFDRVHIQEINQLFGETPINRLSLMSNIQLEIDKRFLKVETPRPLNYIDYNRTRAFQELESFCGFEYYGRKHLENILTAFTQLYWLPKKFNVDKRSSHLSSMIVSGQMTREQALLEFSDPIYDEPLMEQYLTIIKQKLELSDDAFKTIMAAPIHQHTDYKTEKNTLPYKVAKSIYRIIK